MSKLAENRLYDLYVDADHIDSLVLNARAHAEGKDLTGALEFLRLAQEPARRVQMRLDDAIRAIEEAKASADALALLEGGES